MQDVPIPDATRPDPIDPGEQGTGDPAQQAHGERGVLAGTVCWLPTVVRCVCCILRMWRRRSPYTIRRTDIWSYQDGFLRYRKLLYMCNLIWSMECILNSDNIE